MLNWLVIGIGDITTKRVLPGILSEPRSKLVGIVTRDPRKAEPYHVPAWTDLEAALEHSGADAVYIGSPVFLHAPQSIACLRAGKHVLCEKPMAMNYAEACSMQQASIDSNRLLGIAYYRRMYPKVNRAKDLIEAGAIGRPVLADAAAHDWFHPTGEFRAWLIDPERSGGGPLYDIASHRIDLMNYLFGAPVRATGQISTIVHPTRVEDNATVLIEYQNGVRSIVDARWHSHVTRDEFRVRGTDGEIDLTPLNGSRLVYPGGSEEIPAPANLHYPCIEEFATTALDGSPFRSLGASALLTDWITGQVVVHSEVLNAL
jgi:1,5-anhydro-D-fructose reductase (1,5-anhydro-D-mannitol-forming)